MICNAYWKVKILLNVGCLFKKETKFNPLECICANNRDTIMSETTSHKKHADFQSSYRRSFNFGSALKKDKLELNEQGQLILKSDEK
jgi:hypothetical protein